MILVQQISSCAHLGVDEWYVSNVSIFFDCSMLLYYPFWMFMGLHIYIIFGTNLLTGGPTQIVVFAYFRVPPKRNIKWSPNGMKPSGTWFSQQTWSRRLGVGVKKRSRRARGRGRAYPPGRALHPRGQPGAPLACTAIPSGWFPSKINFSSWFCSVLTPSDIPFPRNTKIDIKQQIWAGPPVNRLVPKII